jgi:RNA polymerase sigma factor (sigma-70 family)
VADLSKAEQSLRWQAMSRVRDDVLRRVGRLDSDDAEDCLHEAMLRAAVRPDLDLDSRRLVPYLVQATRWRAVDRRRAREASTRASTRLAVDSTEEQVSPEDVVAVHDLADSLLRAVHELPLRERDVIRHRAAGFDARETARRLGISYKAQEGALTRARSKLMLVVAAGAATVAGALRRVTSSRTRTGLTASLAAAVLVGVPWGPHPDAGGTHWPRHTGRGIVVDQPPSTRAAVRMLALGPLPRTLALPPQVAPVAAHQALGAAVGSPLVAHVGTGAPIPASSPGYHNQPPDPRRLLDRLPAPLLSASSREERPLLLNSK